MRITSLLGMYAVVFAILVTSLIGLTLRNIERSKMWEDRTELAHLSLQEHLLLQSKIYQLLKQHGDALIIGDRDNGAGEEELTMKIAGSIARIRGIIAAEIDMVGEEEIEELELLAELERMIAHVTRELTLLTSPNPTPEQIEKLADLLDRQIDEELFELIQSAIEEEQEEVAETRLTAQAFRQNTRIFTWGAGGAAVFVMVLGIWSYFGLIHQPFQRLMNLLQSYGSGDFSRSVPPSGGAELRKMSRVLNKMAAMLRQREQEQKQQSEILEQRVAERTKELERLLRQIELSESNRKRMMADISHELRTPLTIIRGEAEVALRGTGLNAETSDWQTSLRTPSKNRLS